MIFSKMIKKIKWVNIIMTLIVMAIVIRLGYSQFYAYEELSLKATQSWQRGFPLEAARGKIYDSQQKVLVDNLTTSSLIIVPSQVKDYVTTANQLSKILGCSKEKILEKVKKKVSVERIQPEGRQLTEEKAYQIDRLKLPGVYLVQDTLRYYPHKNYLAQTLGFVGIDNQGLVGLELKYDEYLSGVNGSINYYMNAKSQNLNIYPADYVYPTNGMDIELTIDSRVQDVVERELNNAYTTYNPDSILCLAMDPRNGKILAMCSKPDFDPNDYKNADSQIYNRNLPIWKSYEPGSTFKIITFSSALNEKLFDMDKDTYYDRGYEIVKGARIKSWKKGGHGLQTFREVLQNSSNPGFVEIGRRLGKERLYQYIQDFGLTKKTGVDLTGESSGIMFDYDKFNEVEQATVAFGQGISVTPIQLVRAVCACVNGGQLYKPYIVNKVYNSKTHEVVVENQPEKIRQVITSDTSAKVRDAMEGVVTDGGGKNAYIDGYRIGGKTGTAQRAINGTYAGNGYILSFLGVAPIDNPQIVLYLAMDNPKKCVQYGGTTAAPIARKIFMDVLPALHVKKVTQQREKAYVWTDVKTYDVENYVGKTKKEVKNEHYGFEFLGSGDYVIDQLPRVGEKIEDGQKVKIMLGKKP
ncbi:MAG: penicillin-binding transpeptidase domain-containing protein [Longibaculum muris]|nr:penicillin-binding transpeptidase domain-containing protein [Longibaculum muris]MCR1886848.1 penicillin-binding transpeptidase domain-containing protein [Longibaculum muris]MED9813323.1 penicillin-binding transpeptidase domain-containing protein [Longibaculum muris]